MDSNFFYSLHVGEADPPEMKSSMPTCEALAGRQRLGEGRREEQFRGKFYRRASQIGGRLRLGEETGAY